MGFADFFIGFFYFSFWKNNIYRKIIDLGGDASQIDWDQIKYFFNKSAKMCSSDKTDFVKKILYLVWINSSDVLTKINDFLMYIILPQKNPIKRPEKVGWSHFFKKSAKMFRQNFLLYLQNVCIPGSKLGFIYYWLTTHVIERQPKWQLVHTRYIQQWG